MKSENRWDNAEFYCVGIVDEAKKLRIAMSDLLGEKNSINNHILNGVAVDSNDVFTGDIL